MASPPNHNDGEHGTISDAERKALKDRLGQLGGKLDDVKARQPKPVDNEGRATAMGAAFRLSVEMVAGVAVGFIIGYALDTWLGTKPLMLIVCLLLGAAAGIYNAVRVAQKMNKTS